MLWPSSVAASMLVNEPIGFGSHERYCQRQVIRHMYLSLDPDAQGTSRHSTEVFVAEDVCMVLSHLHLGMHMHILAPLSMHRVRTASALKTPRVSAPAHQQS